MGVEIYPKNKWFLALCKPNSHLIAEKNLTRQGFEVFLPMQEETRRARGRFLTRMQPLFPGYVFVAVDLSKGIYRKIHSTYGISRLVSFGEVPATVPSELIRELRACCDQDGKMLPQEDLDVGDQVKLIKGPFADFVATVDKISSEQRIWVLLDLLGRQTRVAVASTQVQRAWPGGRV